MKPEPDIANTLNITDLYGLSGMSSGSALHRTHTKTFDEYSYLHVGQYNNGVLRYGLLWLLHELININITNSLEV
jgi:hypothetical protein